MVDAADCLPCTQGHFCILGSSLPTPCAPGSFAATTGHARCTTCSPGQYQDAFAGTSCQSCATGHWCTSDAQISCSENTYNPLPNASRQTDCTRCPERTTTLTLDGRTSVDDCSCSEGFYFAPENHTEGREGCIARCCTCPIGTNCTYGSISLATLPLARGYFRLARGSVDVRRCPDAAANCSANSHCPLSTSGCRGGDGDTCMPGLNGTFCRSCAEPFHYYVRATTEAVAHCEPCEEVSSSRSVVIILLFLSCAVVVAFIAVIFTRMPANAQQLLRQLWHAATQIYRLPNKLKILVGFYQIAARVESVYDILLPAEVRQLLLSIQLTISIGIDGVPLACVGANGYIPRLLFWMMLPLIVVVATSCVGAARVLISTKLQASRAALVDATLPGVLRIFFLSYPIVTNVAFEAFSCFQFEDGAGYLMADVSIECYTSEHRAAQAIACVAILLYPVGLFLLNGALLFRVRKAVLAGKPTPLSRSVAFLHREYQPLVYFWELVEMARRFLLVGIYVVGPYHSGSMMQLALAALTCIIFLVIQVQALPYRSPTDNSLAIGCSFSLAVLFLTCIFYKVSTLTELHELQARMSHEQREDFVLPAAALTFIITLSIVGSLVLSAILLAFQIVQRRQELKRQQELLKERRLRRVDDDSVVMLGPPSIPEIRPPSLTPAAPRPALSSERSFHIFLSHVWGTGQDQMRILKQRLLEMLPDISVFLDIDDLVDITKLEEEIDRSAAVLIFCTNGYFQSKNCMRELVYTVATGKPIITLFESDAAKGGLTRQQVHDQLEHSVHGAAASLSKFASWGFAGTLASIWGYELPSATELFQALCASEPVEWNRLQIFQDVTMQRIVERLLPDGHPPTYLQGDLTRRKYSLLSPSNGRRYHAYCSKHNAGADILADEVRKELKLDFDVATNFDQLDECECMLVYLTSLTWTRGEDSDALAKEVSAAMAQEKPLLLAHEAPGIDDPKERHACEFACFFSTTPAQLISAGIYAQIAAPLKGRHWREASLSQMMRNAFSVQKHLKGESASAVTALLQSAASNLSSGGSSALRRLLSAPIWPDGSSALRRLSSTPVWARHSSAPTVESSSDVPTAGTPRMMQWQARFSAEAQKGSASGDAGPAARRAPHVGKAALSWVRRLQPFRRRAQPILEDYNQQQIVFRHSTELGDSVGIKTAQI